MMTSEQLDTLVSWLRAQAEDGANQPPSDHGKRFTEAADCIELNLRAAAASAKVAMTAERWRELKLWLGAVGLREGYYEAIHIANELDRARAAESVLVARVAELEKEYGANSERLVALHLDGRMREELAAATESYRLASLTIENQKREIAGSRERNTTLMEQRDDADHIIDMRHEELCRLLGLPEEDTLHARVVMTIQELRSEHAAALEATEAKRKERDDALFQCVELDKELAAARSELAELKRPRPACGNQFMSHVCTKRKGHSGMHGSEDGEGGEWS